MVGGSQHNGVAHFAAQSIRVILGLIGEPIRWIFKATQHVRRDPISVSQNASHFDQVHPRAVQAAGSAAGRETAALHGFGVVHAWIET
jgi:hypothetical protein